MQCLTYGQNPGCSAKHDGNLSSTSNSSALFVHSVITVLSLISKDVLARFVTVSVCVLSSNAIAWTVSTSPKSMSELKITAELHCTTLVTRE